MKKLLLALNLMFAVSFSQAQIIINEVQANAGNYEGNGGEWIELKNIGATPQNLSCWKLSNGGSLQVSFPSGLTLGAGKYLLVGNAAKVMCATCDFHSLNGVFTLNTAGYGPGVGAYSNTVFLNTDATVNGGCGCMTGTGALNNGSGLGDRIVLLDNTGTIIDAMMYGGGDYYGAAALAVNFSSTSTCPSLPAINIPAVSDIVYDGRIICNDISGCNSSFARIPDGNNGATVAWSQTGNLSCTGCTNPCVSGATDMASHDDPTPGLENSTPAWTATLNSVPVTSVFTNITVCGATPLTFEYQINNYQNVALTSTQASGKLGSYTITGAGAATNFSTANFNNSTGVTTLSSTVTPGSGATQYEFVWSNATTNCTSCPGAIATTVPNNYLSPDKECYVYHKVIVVREDPLAGTPIIACSLPGSILITGATGTNIEYTLQKQTTTGGPFNTIAGPQSSNSFAGIIDDDADPALPNYQVLISTNNTVCPNLTPVTVAVPAGCLGNPVCPSFVTVGTGALTFAPASLSTVCAGSPVQFDVTINGVCTNGQVEIKYDFDPAFDPYTQGTTLGFGTTQVGPTPAPTTANGRVYISEVTPRPFNAPTCAFNPNGASANSGEWVELYNAGPGAADISGWILSDGDWTATIPGGTIITNGGYYLIGGGGTYCTSGVVPDLNLETCNCVNVDATQPTQDIMNLTDGNEQVALFDCSGSYIDGVVWGAGQGLPDVTSNISPIAGCGNYITSKSVSLPAFASFANTGGGLSPNVGRSRTSTNTWITTNTTTTLPTPKAANSGGTWNGSTIAFGSTCPAPSVFTTMTVNLPDTCSGSGPTDVTIKAIYRPDPVAPCLKSDVTATATYTIPSCESLTLSGDGNYCEPATAPVVLTSSGVLSGLYDVTLSNGTNTATVNGLTGAGPFSTNVANSGTWFISSITPPVGVCAPRKVGNAVIAIDPVPVVTASPATVNACYLYYFDLNSVNSQISTTPGTSDFKWYDASSGGALVNTNLNPLSTTTYYASPTSGAPSYCEGSVRTPVSIEVVPLPDAPTVSCNGVTVTFTPPSPNCIPSACPGLEYSANGLNWSSATTYTFTDPGWAGWGAPSNSIVYIRNTSNSNCYNYIYFASPCSAPLPATLLAFDGRLTTKKEVALQWSTSQEYNVSHFEIERSNQQANFVRIGMVKATGSSTANNLYALLDVAPLGGENYYRLKIVDEDGQYTYSNVIMVNNDDVQTQLTGMYPNPAHDALNIEMNLVKTEVVHIQVLDAVGHEVTQWQRTWQRGTHAEQFSVKGLAAGNYVLRIMTSQGAITRKLVKD